MLRLVCSNQYFLFDETLISLLIIYLDHVRGCMDHYLFRDAQTGEMLGTVPSKPAAARLLDGGVAAEQVDLFRVYMPEDADTGRVSLQRAYIGTAA